MKLICWRLLRGWRGLFGVLATEALDAARGVYQALLAREERVAVGADFQADPAFVGRAGLEGVSARAVDLDGSVCGVNSGLCHDLKIPFLQFTQFTLDSS
jgi:hypothetical protein